MSNETMKETIGRLAYIGAAVVYVYCLLSVYGEMASQIM